MCVLQARQPSRWSHVTVRETHAIQRGGWSLTGGVTFYRSPVTLMDCTFDGSRGEDGLNVFAAHVVLNGVRFRNCDSDAFDGDFVTGVGEACVFEAVAGDGLDLSGSDFTLKGSRFEDLGDKAISAGEGTRLTVEGGLVRRVSIGVAAKDGSAVRVRGLGIEEVENFALAVFVKKPAYGPASLEAERLRLGAGARERLVVQLGSRLTLDGEEVPGAVLDVERLYREGVLGR